MVLQQQKIVNKKKSPLHPIIYNMIFGTELKEKKIREVKKFQHEWGKDDIFQLHFWLKNYIYI
jgi:hypothetical protein